MSVFLLLLSVSFTRNVCTEKYLVLFLMPWFIGKRMSDVQYTDCLLIDDYFCIKWHIFSINILTKHKPP